MSNVANRFAQNVVKPCRYLCHFKRWKSLLITTGGGKNGMQLPLLFALHFGHI